MKADCNIFVGIDVSKKTLDISLSGQHFKITNAEKPLSVFIQEKLVSKKIMPALVCLESTGGYEIVAIKCLQKHDMPVHRAHPNRIHAFATAAGHFAKTDKLDAQLLEKYAAFVSVEEKGDKPLSETAYKLSELKSVEHDLMNDLHAWQCRSKHLNNDPLVYAQAQIDFIQQQLVGVREKIEKVLETDEQLMGKRKVLMSFPGVARQTSNALLCELPELGMLSKKEIASLVGVAPKNYESGTKKAKGHIMGGRFYVRKALYMAALVASKFNPKLKQFYDRLLTAKKPKKVALVAVMRKIIIYLNGMIRNNKMYEDFIYA